MRTHQLLGAGLISIALAAPVYAADPPPAPVPAPKPEAKVDPAIDIPRQLGPAEALARGRELRQRVNTGDAQAAFDFAVMLSQCGRFGPAADPSTVEEWMKLANGRSAFDWIMLAAEAGNQPAIGAVCRMAQDYLAPAHVQEQAKARCEVLRQKYGGSPPFPAKGASPQQ
jgi:hypothetical protein